MCLSICSPFFCNPRGLHKLDVFGEITFSQRIWVEAINSYFFLVPRLRWPLQTRKIIRILNVYIGNAPRGSHSESLVIPQHGGRV